MSKLITLLKGNSFVWFIIGCILMLLALFLPVNLLAPAATTSAISIATWVAGGIAIACMSVNALFVSIIGYGLYVTTIVQNVAALTWVASLITSSLVVPAAVTKMLLIKKCLMIGGSLLMTFSGVKMTYRLNKERVCS